MSMSCPATVPVGDVARSVFARHALHRAVAAAVRRADRRPCVTARATHGRRSALASQRCGARVESRVSSRVWAAASVALSDGYDGSSENNKPISDAPCDAASDPLRELPPLLQMPTTAAALKVGSPVVAVGLLRSAFHLTDAYWAGALGPEHLSALMYNAFAVWLIALVCSVVATGVQAFVSNKVGAGDDARGVAAVVANGLWGACATYVVLLCAAPLVPALYAQGLGLDVTHASYTLGKGHLQAMFVGSFGLVFGNVLEATCRGLGRSKESLNCVVVAVLAAAVLDPLLMFGWGPFPKCGIAGAAIGAALAACLNVVLHLWALRDKCGVALRWTPPNLQMIKNMAAIGLPLASSGVVFTLVTIALGRVASGCGPHHLAAMSLGQKFEATAFTVCEGFRLACATLVGQWGGAGDQKAAKRAASTIVKTCILSVVPFAIVFFVMGSTGGGVIEAIAGGAGRADTQVVSAAALYLKWNSFALLFLAIEAVAEGAFTGAGNTLPVLVIGAACNVLRVPTAHYLAFSLGFGITGLWATIVGSQVVKAVLKWWWFKREVRGGKIKKAK